MMAEVVNGILDLHHGTHVLPQVFTYTKHIIFIYNSNQVYIES